MFSRGVDTEHRSIDCDPYCPTCNINCEKDYIKLQLGLSDKMRKRISKNDMALLRTRYHPAIVERVKDRISKRLAPIKKTVKSLKEIEARKALEDMAEEAERREIRKKERKIIEFESKLPSSVNTHRQTVLSMLQKNPKMSKDEKLKLYEEYIESLDHKEVYA